MQESQEKPNSKRTKLSMPYSPPSVSCKAAGKVPLKLEEFKDRVSKHIPGCSVGRHAELYLNLKKCPSLINELSSKKIRSALAWMQALDPVKHRNPHIILTLVWNNPSQISLFNRIKEKDPSLAFQRVPGLDWKDPQTLVLKLCVNPHICVPCDYPAGATAKLVSFVLVVCQGKMLLTLDRHRSFWGLPGGVHEVGENWTTTAVRELYEETGFLKADGTRVKGTELTGLIHYRQFTKESIVSGKIDPNVVVDVSLGFLYECKEEPTIKLNTAEVEQYKWVTEAELTQEIDDLNAIATAEAKADDVSSKDWQKTVSNAKRQMRYYKMFRHFYRHRANALQPASHNRDMEFVLPEVSGSAL